jgi:DNA repair protein SbcC/Rad50
MKILRLRFKNLNSLAGEWDIDFTHPDYVSNGIFAITGPTGAGNSTILDAVCVALYGQTPRLGRITQSENEIMSRQTGECFAEVEFETAKGRFRCHWGQHRSRKQSAGQLQQPRHEIVEAVSGAVLESRLTAVARMVEDVTGMDFDRFTRSMLLAQGGFAVFLQATPDRRAPILEQITGTAIYSRISVKVHECTTEQRRKLETLRRELDGMQFLTPEALEELHRDQAAKQQEERLLSVTVHEIREAQAWKERIVRLEDELVRLDRDRLSVEEQKKAAAPELERLAQAARAATLEGDYVTVTGIRKHLQDERSELAHAQEMLPALQREVRAAVDTADRMELDLANARDEQLREAERIRTTRALDVKIGEADSRLLGMRAEHEEIIRQECDHRSAIAAIEADMQTTGGLLGDSTAYLDGHFADATLAEALTGIEQQLRLLKTVDRQCSERRHVLALQAASWTKAEQVLHQAHAAWDEASRAAAEAGNRLKVLQSARETLLQGRDISSWRDDAEALSTRRNRLENLAATVARIGETGKKLSALQVHQADLEKNRHSLVGQEEALARECGLRADVIRQLREKIVLLNRVRDLEEERSYLVDGTPCPLCGSPEHPYAAGNMPQPDQAQSELEEAQAAHTQVSERLSRVRVDLAGVVKETEQTKRELLECRERLVLDETRCSEECAELAVVAGSSSREAYILNELESCRRLFTTSREAIREAEERDREVLKAKMAVESARDALNRHDKARHAAELEARTAGSEQERLTLECEALHNECVRIRAEAERTIEPYGCKDLAPGNADGMFAELTTRRNEFIRMKQERERLEKARAELDGRKSREQALLAAVENSLAGLNERIAAGTAHRDNLADERRGMFGERNPDSEEQRLNAACDFAGTLRDEALQVLNRTQNSLSGMEQQIGKLTGSVIIRTTELSALESALHLHIIEAGFADETAFSLARLPQARVDELSRLAESIQRDEVEIAARRRDRTTELQQERGKKLSEMFLEQIREENSTKTAQLGELHRALGGIEQLLLQQDELRQRQRDRLQTLEQQKSECARWEQLHALIGSSDGKKFRNFAQGLTFELMVAHANRQLLKMSDRYILVRDRDEPLELNVIDNYQAGEIRSTRNLSGGESFIASLALALGLSGMASRNVRVDSLFLDEGFGTLDEDALETALETLSGLQQEGKLIGIISHVPALKERIGTQIQVESGSTGRGSLSGPGCRRVV